MRFANEVRGLAVAVVGAVVAALILNGFRLVTYPWAITIGIGGLAIVEAFFLWRSRYRKSATTIGLVNVNIGSNTPIESICEGANHSFYFWGISGKRTASNPRCREAMIRIGRNGGEIRFLLLSPKSSKLVQRAGDEQEGSEAWINDITATRTRLQQLAERETINIQVRYFDRYPVWRMNIIDRRTIYLNWFLPGKQGPESPELKLSVVDDGICWPFLREFDDCWEEAADE
jgi:hypothetical protein